MSTNFQDRFKLALLIATAWLTLPIPADATDRVFVPADMVNTESSILQILERLQKRPESSKALSCETTVTPKGRYGHTHCYVKGDSKDDLLRPLLDGMYSAKAKPATVNGKRKFAWLQFTVQYDADAQAFELYQHLVKKGSIADRDYFGPQRYHGPTNCSFPKRAPTILIGYEVGPDGQIRNIQITPESYKKYLAPCFGRSEYIPAYRKGVAEKSVVVEPLIPRSKMMLDGRRTDSSRGCNLSQC